MPVSSIWHLRCGLFREEPLQDRFDGLPLREPRALVKLRRKADLIVNVSLPGEYR